jgi:hypothetical protein
VGVFTHWNNKLVACGYTNPPATLEEVASFIQQHRHLPGIPNEKEVLENGIDAGEMNRLLLKNVEELTLYLIEMKKEIETLKK